MPFRDRGAPPEGDSAGADHLRRWLRAVWARVTGVRISTKMLGIVLGLTLLFGNGILQVIRTPVTEALMEELHRRGAAVVTELSSHLGDSVVDDTTGELSTLLESAVRSHTDLLYVFVVDETGRLVADSVVDGVVSSTIVDRVPRTGEPIAHDHYETDAGVTHEFAASIPEGDLGVVVVGVGEDRLRETIDGLTRRVLILTIGIGVAGEAAAVFLTWVMNRPLLDLVAMAKRVGAGDLTARVRRRADDELGELADAFNNMVDGLAKGQERISAEERARTALLEKLLHAREEERFRIARKLHDGVGQELTSLSVRVSVLDRHVTTEGRPTLLEMQRILDAVIGEMRELSHELRPAVLDDLGLGAALDRWKADFGSLHPNLTIHMHVEMPDRLPTAVETTLYRIVQEAMTNAARHSDASAIGVIVRLQDGSVHAIIEDDGTGFEMDGGSSGIGFGIQAMRERAHLLSGTFQMESGPHGTTVFVQVPL